MDNDVMELGGVPLSVLRERLAAVERTRDLITATLPTLDVQRALLEELITDAERRESEGMAAFMGASGLRIVPEAGA